MSSATQKISLLDLTPVCLQNTNNIMNTLIFMCLDQGHDFRDKSNRTLNKGNRGWVDIDYRGAGYLNKISEEVLSRYAPNEGDNKIESPQIFGKQQFVTGLINTTFKGGNGTYGLVIVDDEYYNTISSQSSSTSAAASTSESYVKDNAVSNFIVDKLKQRIESESEDPKLKITFYLDNLNDNYYILSNGDDSSSEGVTISDNFGDKKVSFLFLPLYKRAYNKGMHKLWDFNTKKHIFVVSLDEMFITRRNTPLEFTINSNRTKISCKKLTTIDLIIPTYTFNTIGDNQGGISNFLKGLSFHLKEKKGTGLFTAIEEKDLGPANIHKLFEEQRFTQKDTEVVLNYFLKTLFEGGDGVSTTEADGPPSIEYKINESDGIGYFTLKNLGDTQLYKCVPRGVKYWFEDCHNSVFKYFVKLLYAYQKPFIHPRYNISNANLDINVDSDNIKNLDDVKRKISSILLTPLPETSEGPKTNLEKYIAYKNDGVKFDETTPFILKQYGVIPDTTIGTGKKHTTINHLINSLNNVANDTTCESDSMDMVGGETGDLNGLLQLFPTLSKDIKLIESNNNYARISKSVKNIYPTIAGNATAKKILIDYLKNTFGDELIDGEINKIESKLEEAKSLETPQYRPQEVASLSLPSGVTTVASETVSIPTIQTEAKPVSTVYFDNINSVNRDFNLGLSADKIKSELFVEISSETPNKNIELYETEYANSLQQYYDFIPQANSSSENKNYFKNCWQTIDFFQENSPEKGQTGGEGEYQYPYRFTVTSAQIDGSLQGGQSIPQYHPPEVDIYMPIFDLEGDGNLKGIIARMVFVKEILANAINSKSRAVVFCHFAYVDFESTGVSPPSNISEYPTTLKKLLDYTIEHTYYVNTNDDCINLEALNQIEEINADDQIDFKIELRNPETPSSIGVRKWYKYYTYTSGPGVKEHFVPPTDYNNIGDILHFSKDVANRIANVGDKLIKNSGKLRKAFGAPEESSVSTETINQHPGAVLFVKLFLIRNKYTGDKSRATDTLFLNQTKYLEGIQISNDENTLFNALMFGQNTIWSTSAKTVFNMSPYLTKSGKMPIDGGFYIDTLCQSLRGNPSIKIEAIQSEESHSDDQLVRMEYKTSIVNKISDLYKNCELESKKFYTDFEFSLIDALINYGVFQEKYNDFSKLYNNYDKNLLNLNVSEGVIQLSTTTAQTPKWDAGGNFLDNIVDTTKECLGLLTTAKGKIQEMIQGLVIFFNNIKQNCSNFNESSLDDLIFYIVENISWWNIIYYHDIIIQRYCYMCLQFLCTVQTAITEENICTSGVGKLNTYFKARKEKILTIVSPDLTFPKFGSSTRTSVRERKTTSSEQSEKPVLSCLPKNLSSFEFCKKSPLNCRINKPVEQPPKLEVSINSSKEEITENEDRLKTLSSEIIKILSSVVEPDIANINGVIDNILRGRETGTETASPIPQGNFFIRQVRPDSVNKTDIVEASNNTKLATFGGMNGNIDDDELNLFYENSYKCNVGNYLKGFIKIITSINKQYIDSNINENDTVKDIIVKILVKDINLINSSYTPVLNVEEIVDTINKIDETYTVEQMNTIKNLYSSQLELYSLINTVINFDYENADEREYLVDLINENINENRFNEFKLSFTKAQLLNAVLTDNVSSLFIDSIQDLDEDVEMTYENTDKGLERQSSKRMRDTEENDTEQTETDSISENDTKKQKILDFSSIFNQYGINNSNQALDNRQSLKRIRGEPTENYSAENYSKKQKNNYNILDNFGQKEDNFNKNRLGILGFGGSIKNKRKQINKTRTNKRKNKIGTIKKRKSKIRRYTRRR